MKKFVIGMVIGLMIGFVLGVNFGKGAPLLSNPFATKPETMPQALERMEKSVEGEGEKAKQEVEHTIDK